VLVNALLAMFWLGATSDFVGRLGGAVGPDGGGPLALLPVVVGLTYFCALRFLGRTELEVDRAAGTLTVRSGPVPPFAYEEVYPLAEVESIEYRSEIDSNMDRSGEVRLQRKDGSDAMLFGSRAGQASEHLAQTLREAIQPLLAE
jgi:hypothetical protein